MDLGRTAEVRSDAKICFVFDDVEFYFNILILLVLIFFLYCSLFFFVTVVVYICAEYRSNE